jgi:hypothetical protein
MKLKKLRKIFENVELKAIILSSNNLTTISNLPEEIVTIIVKNNSISDPKQIENLSKLSQLSYIDISNNKLNGNFNLNKQTGYINFIGNENLKISNAIFGEPKLTFEVQLNSNLKFSSLYECFSAYSNPKSNNLDNFNSTTKLEYNYKLDIDPISFNYSNCQCAFGYMVKMKIKIYKKKIEINFK